MPNLDEMKDKAQQAGQNMQQDAQQGQQSTDEASGTEQKKPGMMDQAKQKLDADQDGDFDMDDVKKMGGDAVDKVKGLFKKD